MPRFVYAFVLEMRGRTQTKRTDTATLATIGALKGGSCVWKWIVPGAALGGSVDLPHFLIKAYPASKSKARMVRSQF